MKSLARREEFKMKHIVRGLKLHEKLGRFYKEEVKKKREENRRADVAVKNLEKLIEEKMRNVNVTMVILQA